MGTAANSNSDLGATIGRSRSNPSSTKSSPIAKEAEAPTVCRRTNCGRTTAAGSAFELESCRGLSVGFSVALEDQDLVLSYP